MKKLLVVCIALACATPIGAQSRWTFGCYSSAGASHIRYGYILPGTPEKSHVSPIRAVQAGVFAEYRINAYWTLRAGPAWQHCFDRQNAYTPYYWIEPEKHYSQAFTCDDLILPMDIVLKIPKSRRGFHMFTGLAPDFALRRHVQQTTRYPDYFDEQETSTDITQLVNFPTFEIFYQLGLGWSFRLGNKARLFLEPCWNSNFPSQFFHMKEQQGWPTFTTPGVSALMLRVGVGLE